MKALMACLFVSDNTCSLMTAPNEVETEIAFAILSGQHNSLVMIIIGAFSLALQHCQYIHCQTVGGAAQACQVCLQLNYAVK